ncbi:MAG: phosphohydrolase [Deltaproteobacteria bacterium RIFOXYD12_FULL_57_12]|nr:MAG: phosphohydrolase [Deltaproteobacteria bacterium RIFOXYD12_FULL_57_12]
MITDLRTDPKLLRMRDELDRREQAVLSPLAAVSGSALRRRSETQAEPRQAFAQDGDRILHSRAYTRYIDKTQVFYMVDNDHITHRVLHVQLVSKIGRTIGRFLGLNEDLIEAIALGHDIGHPPFGHDGEKELARLCRAHGLPGFQHNIQSVQFLDRIERGGRGWNLTLQTLDGILCHDGEVHNQALQPARRKDFADFDRELAAKAANPGLALFPMTLEGCVVRFSDTIAYIGRDIEDAIELKLISRSEIPAACRARLGDTNGKIVYRLVEDLLVNSSATEHGLALDAIGFSPGISETLQELKRFNYQRIYLNPAIKTGLQKIKECYDRLFAVYLDDIARGRRDSVVFTEFIDKLDPAYVEDHVPAAIVRDFIAGMTDDYFLARAAACGCAMPDKLAALS